MNISPYNYYKIVKKGNQERDLSIIIDTLDLLPVFPEQKANRPFSIEINPMQLKQKITIEKFSDEMVMLLVVNQIIIEPYLFFFKKLHSSKALCLVDNLCGFRYYNKTNDEQFINTNIN